MMRDDQARRYARHIMLPDVGRRGQSALLAATARISLPEPEPAAELVAASYLAAGGVGTLAMPGVTDAHRAELSTRGPDTQIVDDGAGREVVLAPRPAWWPSAPGDE